MRERQHYVKVRGFDRNRSQRVLTCFFYLPSEEREENYGKNRQYSMCPGGNSNQAPPEQKLRILLL